MDDKTLTAVATSLALMQIQVNALMLLLERHTPGAPIKEEFQRLISKGVETVGLETIELIQRMSVAASTSSKRRSRMILGAVSKAGSFF
jgi:hypothetical protein